MKLALGTVQFGMQYGVANPGGRVSRQDAAAIVSHARASGMDTLDTAIAYGDSEERLGAIGVDGWQVVSKLPAIPETCRDVEGWVRSSVRASLDRLRQPHVYGLLLHRPGQLLEPFGGDLYRALLTLKGEGLVRKIGVSIYDPSELDTLCASYQLDLVQSPFNLLDRRLKTSGWLARLAAHGIELHVRSLFLQGLLLMPRPSRPEAFNRWAQVWANLDGWLDASGLTPLEACLRDALSIPEIARVVVGVDSLEHLTEILRAADGPDPQFPGGWAVDEADLINPARWGALA